MKTRQLPKLLIAIACIVVCVANGNSDTRTFNLVPDSVTIEYYFGSTTPTGSKSSDQQIDSIIDSTAQSFFITHGWTDTTKGSLWVASLKNALLTKFPTANVFLVDWSPISSNLIYPMAKANTVYVGNQVASFIKNNNIDPAKIHFIGHSLGSHVAGIAGYRYSVLTGNKFARITGLDPATPLYSNLVTPMTDKLDKSDAIFVDTIFTSMAFFRDIIGVEYSVGHVNFFPNGGDSQPGCLDEINLDFAEYTSQPVDQWSACSHGRAIDLFRDSITNGNLVGYKCTYPDLQNGRCYSTTSNMLGYPATAANPGDFVLTTGATSPYANEDFNLVLTVNSIDVPLGIASGTLWVTLPQFKKIDLASSLVPISNGQTIRKFAPVQASLITKGTTISSFWYTLSLLTTGNLKANIMLATPDNAKMFSLGNPVTLKNGAATALLAA